MQAATFIHGNRLEVLADRLIDDLDAGGRADPMQPQVVVVAHPALGRWLQERIAHARGIATNIAFPLPSSFAWDVLRASEPDLPPDSAFSRSALVWRIHAQLPALAGNAAFEPVRRYLGDGSDPRRRYDLAVAIARAFDEYMVARPEWIRAWNRGLRVLDDEDEAWQAALWRVLTTSTKEPDRARLMHDVLARLGNDADTVSALPRSIAVFGASFLPPLLLEFYLAVGTHVPLRFYQPNPCLDYWGDLVSERELVRRRALWTKHGRGPIEDYYEVGHPLLASWGTLGREYLKAIHAPDAVVHDDDAFVAPATPHLLGWLQHGLLLLDPAHEAPPPVGAVPSIQIHGCPDRRREIEVLRDQLLRQIEAQPDLKPHDIVVMSPRLDEYVPYIDAVFGDRDDPLALPYSIADVALRGVHPLIDAFARVLALGESRFTASDVLVLLAEPAIARRFALEGDALAWIRTWIDDSAIRWGVDAAFREALGAAALDENSWRFGLDRLLLGYALGDDAAMLGDVVPAPNVEGGAAQALGQLARLIGELEATRDGFAITRTALEWKRWLNERVDALFDAEGGDTAEVVALNELRAAIAATANEAARWLGEERLAFDVMRAALDAAIGDPRVARAGRFGVTFCGMVPMRNVPHRVVCLLGLNAGEFPRRQPPPGFQLMRRHPRPGDRSVREDDRFLFLEALVAARDTFYLSYVDRDVRAGSESPPSPLVDELLGFLRDAHAPEAWPGVEAAIRQQHPVHPFAARYFRRDSTLRSYDRAWWAAAEALAGEWKTPEPFVAGLLPVDPAAPDEPFEVTLDELVAWLRDPARNYFRSALPLRPFAHEASDDVEPFTLDSLERYGLADRLLGARGERPDLHRVQREGGFPLGPAGEAEWQSLIEKVAALEAETVRLLGIGVHAIAGELRAIELPAIGARISGVPRLLFEGTTRALLLRRPAAIRGTDLARLALERALLGGDGDDIPAYAIGWDDGRAQIALLGRFAVVTGWMTLLVKHYRDGLRQPLPLFPRAAQAYARTLSKGGRASPQQAALDVWNDRNRPESAKPLHALIARHREGLLAEDRFEELATDIYLPLYEAMLEVKP